MAESNLTKWPVTIKIEPVIESAILNESFSFYFLTGTMNGDQFNTIKEELPRAAVFQLPLDGDLCVLSALTSRADLDAVNKALPNNWSGRYYSVAKRFHEEYNRVLAK